MAARAKTYKVSVILSDGTEWFDTVVNITGGMEQAQKRAATMLRGKFGSDATYRQIALQEQEGWRVVNGALAVDDRTDLSP